MDDVERMYRHLVRTIRTSFAPYLTQPFEVGELYQTILPYRLHRRELGLETNQDYEMALMELLAGSHGYLVVDDRMRDALKAEQAAAVPNTARIRDFASSHVALAPEALQESGGHGRVPSGSTGATITREAASPLRAGAASAPPTPRSSSTTQAMPAADLRRASRPITVPEDGESCAFCKGALPPGRTISFCPHCGQDLTVVHCPACGSELERGWKFCVTCGRGAAAS
ncbi:MAG: zinc ribbon domain-containing protein [Gemmatimonadaceae bacterium]